MKIYHGTAGKLIDTILKDGILPRSMTGNSNWEKFKSRDDMIYLTTAYPLYFAANAIKSVKTDPMVIFEVDMDRLSFKNLYPDEDFVAQVMAQHRGVGLEVIHEEIKGKLDLYKHTWPVSLAKMGTCSHQGRIPPEAITRYAKIEIGDRWALFESMLDPMIMPINYMARGKFYKDFVKWIMGGRKKLPQIEDFLNIRKNYRAMKKSIPEESSQDVKVNIEFAEKGIAFWKKEGADRTGITVVDLRKKEAPSSATL